MKKNLLFLVFGISVGIHSYGQTKLTNNAALGISPGNSVTCNSGGLLVSDNSFYHIYDLDNYTNVQDTVFFIRMKVGCEETSGGAYNIVGKVHRLVGTPSLANMTLISDDTTAAYPDSSLYIIEIPFDEGYALPGDTLVSEFHLPTNGAVAFYPASNMATESSPTYIVANGCTIPNLVTVASLGFPTMRLIMNLYVNQKPTLSDLSRSIFKDEELLFTDADFLDAFNDNDNDELNMLRVYNLPANGVLDLSGTTLVLGDTILANELSH
jgi:hypothetical protein